MKLVAGQRYLTRNGRRTEPLTATIFATPYPFRDGDTQYTPDGHYFAPDGNRHQAEHDLDLIREAN